jgi:hypothetical protein
MYQTISGTTEERAIVVLHSTIFSGYNGAQGFLLATPEEELTLP